MRRVLLVAMAVLLVACDTGDAGVTPSPSATSSSTQTVVAAATEAAASPTTLPSSVTYVEEFALDMTPVDLEWVRLADATDRRSESWDAGSLLYDVGVDEGWLVRLREGGGYLSWSALAGEPRVLTWLGEPTAHTHEIAIVDVDSRAAHRLIPFPVRTVGWVSPGRVAFTLEQDGSLPDGRRVRAGRYAVDLGSATAVHDEEAGSGPPSHVESPDGRFRIQPDSSRVSIIEVGGETVAHLDAAWFLGWSWVSDEALVMTEYCDFDSGMRLGRLDLRSGEVTHIPTPLHAPWVASWSPDGTRIVVSPSVSAAIGFLDPYTGAEVPAPLLHLLDGLQLATWVGDGSWLAVHPMPPRGRCE